MIKFYMLSILFNLGCLALSLEKVKQIIKETGVQSKSSDKKSVRNAKKLLTIIAFTPVLNILLGAGYISIALGSTDDKIKEMLNK